MVPEIPQKDCKSHKEVEEYLNSLGIYIWHKNDDPEYIKYLLSIGSYVYVAVARINSVRYFILHKVPKQGFPSTSFDSLLSYSILERPNKMMKFLRKGFTIYAYWLGVYDI